MPRYSTAAPDRTDQADERARRLLVGSPCRQHEQERHCGEGGHRAPERVDTGTIRVVCLVDGDRHRLLLGERPEQRRQGGCDLGVVGGRARRHARECLGRQRGEHGPRGRVSRRTARCARQARTEQRSQRTPGGVAVALERRHDRGDGTGEREALHAFHHETRLAHPRLPGDEQRARAALQCFGNQGEHFAVRALATDQRRLVVGVEPGGPAPVFSPDPLGQRRQVTARLLSDVRQSRGELAKRGEGPGAVTRQRPGPHQQMHRRLAVQLQCEGPASRVGRRGFAPRGERLLAQRDERRARSSPVPLPLERGPLFERGRAVHGESLEEITGHEARRVGRALFHERLEP